MNAKDNLFDLAKQLEDTGAVMDKVAIDQAMKLDEKLDILSARFAKVKTVAKEAAVETALAVSDIFTGDFWKLLAANLAKGAGMQSASLASLQMRIKETVDAAVEASKKQEEAGKKAADAAGLAQMKEEELYNERIKLLSQGKENVDLLLKLQEAQEKLNAAIEKGLSHKEKEKALDAVLSIRDQIKAREDEARAYENVGARACRRGAGPREELPAPELLIEPSQLAEADVTKKYVVLDARNLAKFKQDHIPNAVWVNHDEWAKAFGHGKDAEAWGKRTGRSASRRLPKWSCMTTTTRRTPPASGGFSAIGASKTCGFSTVGGLAGRQETILPKRTRSPHAR